MKSTTITTKPSTPVILSASLRCMNPTRYLPRSRANSSGAGEKSGSSYEICLLSKGNSGQKQYACVEFENLALLRAEWQFTGTDHPDGTSADIGGASSKVVRRQPKGNWLYIIDLPWG